ncbi:hypothetical protein Tco_0741820 [Tanacetum coccineum]
MMRPPVKWELALEELKLLVDDLNQLDSPKLNVEEFIIHVLRVWSSKRHMYFPESDPVLSSYMGSGSGPARASCAFSGSDPAWPCVLTGAAASVSLFVRSQIEMVDEDSYHFADVPLQFFSFFDNRLGNEQLVAFGYNGLPLPTTSGSLGVVLDTGSLIVTPPTGARPCGRNTGS